MAGALDLELEELFAGVGAGRRKGGAVDLGLVALRGLTEADLHTLDAAPAVRGPSLIQKLRSSHHTLARLLAEGVNQVNASAITGYSLGRIQQLLDDPSFKDLMGYYQGQVEQIYYSIHERMEALGLDSVEELQRRLDEEPDQFKLRDLMELAQLMLDRAGYAPKAQVQHQHLHRMVSEEELGRIKDAVARRQASRAIPISQRDNGVAVGEGSGRAPILEIVAESRSEGSGKGV